MIKMIE